MTEYSIIGDTITIGNTEDFVAEHILNCGQTFRFEKQNDVYRVCAGKDICLVRQNEKNATIECSNADYFVKYFDLDTDYQSIRKSITDDDIMVRAVEFGKGLRILKQEPLEMIISFIISANNHIPRIKAIIERICKGLGHNCGEYYSFPTLDELASVDISFFESLKAGYRAQYLFDTVQMLKSGFVPLDISQDLGQAGLELMRLKGVGRKVADCILLFGYGRTDVFPVDTWIKKVAKDYYGINDKVREYFIDRFGKASGYAQQYLYYFKRELS